MLTPEEIDSTLNAVVHLAQSSIPGCDAASVTVVDAGKARTAVSSAEVAIVLDHKQYQLGDGPCLEAIAKEATVPVESFAVDQRWPDLAEVAVAHDVHSSLSLPLVARGQPVGALNLYSLHPGGLAEAEPPALLFAEQAAVTVANTVALERAIKLSQQLTVAMEHRDIIGQAKGILMAREGISSDQAFDVLRRASQRSNRKLYELADEIVKANSQGSRR